MRIWLFLGLLAAVALAGGCATLTLTPGESMANYRSIVDTDLHAMADDWNSIWFADRQTRLTRWHTR